MKSGYRHDVGISAESVKEMRVALSHINLDDSTRQIAGVSTGADGWRYKVADSLSVDGKWRIIASACQSARHLSKSHLLLRRGSSRQCVAASSTGRYYKILVISWRLALSPSAIIILTTARPIMLFTSARARHFVGRRRGR